MAVPYSLVTPWHSLQGLESEGLLLAQLHKGHIRPTQCREPATGVQAEINAAIGAQLSQLPWEKINQLSYETKVYLATQFRCVLNAEWWPKAGVILSAVVQQCQPATAVALLIDQISMEEVCRSLDSMLGIQVSTVVSLSDGYCARARMHWSRREWQLGVQAITTAAFYARALGVGTFPVSRRTIDLPGYHLPSVSESFSQLGGDAQLQAMRSDQLQRSLAAIAGHGFLYAAHRIDPSVWKCRPGTTGEIYLYPDTKAEVLAYVEQLQLAFATPVDGDWERAPGYTPSLPGSPVTGMSSPMRGSDSSTSGSQIRDHSSQPSSPTSEAPNNLALMYKPPPPPPAQVHLLPRRAGFETAGRLACP